MAKTSTTKAKSTSKAAPKKRRTKAEIEAEKKAKAERKAELARKKAEREAKKLAREQKKAEREAKIKAKEDAAAAKEAQKAEDAKIQKIIDGLKIEYKSEKDIINSILIDVAEDTYYSSCYIYGLGISYTLKPVKQNTLNKIINKKIDGKTYSNRMWKNKNTVAKMLKKEINDFLNGKTDVNTISKNIKNRFDVNYSISNRLVRTEIAKTQCEANEVWAKQQRIHINFAI